MYPIEGGIGSLPQALATRVNDIEYNSNIFELKHERRCMKIKYSVNDNIKTIEAERVLSSTPLPEIIEMIKDSPEEIHKAARSLVHNSLICVNLGIERSNISDKHWIYFPEDRFIFNRISFPMNFSDRTTPTGKSSVLAEVTFLGDKPNKADVLEKVIEGLIKANILRDKEGIDVVDVETFKYAYVIYDQNHRRNVKLIHDYLNSIKITPMGRFGDWEYHNMDKAILSGKRAAEKS
jgi:UDP-galactopyranose mutase